MEYIDDYIDRMHGRKPVEYHHPALEPILAETYGIIVYQEQIIQIASQLAGYSPGEADLMRRAVGKKKKEELLKHREKFVAGAIECGIPEEAAKQIFDDIEFFARYGFNKAHAADYAVITCQTAYLKAHYPVEYMTALLTVERNNTDKVGMLIGRMPRDGHRGAAAGHQRRATWTSPSKPPRAGPPSALAWARSRTWAKAPSRSSCGRAPKGAPLPTWTISAAGWTCGRSTGARWRASSRWARCAPLGGGSRSWRLSSA